jgi:hypothetical protein
MKLMTYAKSTLVIILLGSLVGCSTTIELNKVTASGKAKLTVTDNRPSDERIHRRDGVRKPIQFFGDEDFESPPLNQFTELLENALPAGTFALNVKKFRVIDIFPQRLNAGTAGALGGALGSLGYSVYITNTGTMTADNITCLVSGDLQSQPISASVSVPYKISPFAGLVKKDASFKSAVNECLSKLAEKAVQVANLPL